MISVCQEKVKLLASGVLVGRGSRSEGRRLHGNHLQALQDPSGEAALHTCLDVSYSGLGQNKKTKESAQRQYANE